MIFTEVCDLVTKLEQTFDPDDMITSVEHDSIFTPQYFPLIAFINWCGDKWYMVHSI